MTAIQLILFNVILLGGVTLLAYAITHDSKGKHKTRKPSH